MVASIFNDVIGPVMRGPSSSHSAAALRIGRLARDLMGGRIDRVLVQFDRRGALATTHASHGSDMGLFGGLLGWEADAERLPDAARALDEAGMDVRIVVGDLGIEHPNGYRLTLENEHERHTLTAVSVGGGMIEVVEIDGFEVSIAGDYAETLIFTRAGGRALARHVGETVQADAVCVQEGPGGQLVEVKGQAFVADAVLVGIAERFEVVGVKRLGPVLPVRSRAGLVVPFETCAEMLRWQADGDGSLWEAACAYESARGGLGRADVLGMMGRLVETWRRSLAAGLSGTEYADRILGCQCRGFAEAMGDGRLLDTGVLNRAILYVTALMEVKSAMGVVVAAPTAGACGAVPGAVLGAADVQGRSDEDAAKALLAGGLIGVFIAHGSTFSAELAGCQAECGAASGMAAAALVTLAGGRSGQAVAAASMALQNVLGMVCDPVAGRVEVPCLGKNVMAAANALACANMALAGYDAVVPLDEVIEAMDRVGRSLPRELRCTGLGGLSTTPTSERIAARLDGPGSGGETGGDGRATEEGKGGEDG